MDTAQVQEVDVRNIESELQRLWHEHTGASGEREGEPLVTVRTLNLVIYSPATKHEEIAALLDPLVAEHPARVIVVDAVPDPSPRAWISVKPEHTVGARLCIGRELITIAAPPQAERELRSVVVPLLVPDLPVYLWWRGRPGFGVTLFDELGRLADRIIIDSANLEDPRSELPWLADAVRATEGAVSDLAWARLTSWRQLVSQFFDAPNCLPYLKRLRSVVLESEGELQSEAVLMAGWLASRLGWRPFTMYPGTPFSLELRQEGNPVRIDFRHGPSSRRSLSRLQLEADTARFEVARTPEPGFLTTSEIAGGTLHRRLPQTEENETQMINRELDLPGHDWLYEQALAMARALLES